MKRLLTIWAMAVTLLLAAGYFARGMKAQTAQAVTIQGGAAHSTCLTPATGMYALCVATDGVWVSNNGAAYFQVVAPSASGVQKVQGVAPGATGNVTVSCTTPAPGTTPAYTTSGATTTLSVAVAAIPITCTGAGS